MAALAPILNAAKYLPASMVLKGLEKVNPKFKNFFTTAASYGLDTNRALDYLTQRFGNPASQQFQGELEQGAEQGTLRPDEMSARQQINSSQLPGRILKGAASFGGAGLFGASGTEEDQPQQQGQGPQQMTQNPAQQPNQPAAAPQQPQQPNPQSKPQGLAANIMNDSFIRQHPELGVYMDQLIKSGYTPVDAALTAKSEKKFSKAIADIEQEVGQRFEDLIAYLFHGKSTKPNVPAESKPDSQSAGSSQQALIEVLNQLKQLRARK